jgi:hypothetical protein
MLHNTNFSSLLMFLQIYRFGQWVFRRQRCVYQDRQLEQDLMTYSDNTDSEWIRVAVHEGDLLVLP